MTLDGVLFLTIGAGIGSLATACAFVRRRVLDELSGRVVHRLTDQ